MSSFLDIHHITSMSAFTEIKTIHNDQQRSYQEKEELLRGLLGKGGSIDCEVVDFFLNACLSNNFDEESLEAIEKYSRLFADILRYSKLSELLTAIAQRNKEKSAHSLLSMVRISWKLNSLETINTTNIEGVIRFCLHFLPADDLSLSQESAQLLSIFTAFDFTKWIPLIIEASSSYNSNATLYLRFLGVVAHLGGSDESAALAACSAGGLTRIFQCCQSDDILLQINAIELLVEYAKTTFGLNELCKQGIMDWLIANSCGSPNSPPNPLIASEALRTIGDIFQHASTQSFQFVEQITSDGINVFLNTIEEFLGDYDESNKINGLAVMAQFASISYRSLGLVVQHHQGQLVDAWYALLNSSKVELSGAALHALANILDQTETQYLANERQIFVTPSSSSSSSSADAQAIVNMKKQLFFKLGEVKRVTSVQYLLKCAKQPVATIREAAMNVLRAIVAQEGTWGMETLFGGGNYHLNDFWVYLKDRTTEHDKRGKEFKFAIIEAIAHSPHRHHLSEDVNQTIDTMIRQGPFYMPPRVEEMETI